MKKKRISESIRKCVENKIQNEKNKKQKKRKGRFWCNSLLNFRMTCTLRLKISVYCLNIENQYTYHIYISFCFGCETLFQSKMIKRHLYNLHIFTEKVSNSLVFSYKSIKGTVMQIISQQTYDHLNTNNKHRNFSTYICSRFEVIQP